MKKKITFTDLVDKIAEETGASKQLVHDLLKETVNLTREGLDRDGYVNLLGLGRFHLKWHKARPGRNPRTGEKIEILAHSSVNFKAEAKLRNYINRKYSDLHSEVLEGEIEPAKAEPTDVSIQPEKKPSKPVTETPPSIQKQEKKRFARWLWMIIPLLVILLVYLFWPSPKPSETDIQEPVVFEKVEEVVPVLPEEAEQPVEKPVIEEVKPAIQGGLHIIKPGENLWTISKDFYNQADLWPNIFRVNLNKIMNPDFLSVGDEVQIPSLQGKPGDLTQEDIKEIAEGFIEVYLFYKKLNKEKAIYYLWVAKKWNVNEVIDNYKDKIEKTDLELVDNIEGFPRIK